MAILDAAQLIRFNFEEFSLNWLRMSFDGKHLQTLHNTACNGPVCSHLFSGDHICSRIWSMNDLVHMEAELRNFGLRYQVMLSQYHSVAHSVQFWKMSLNLLRMSSDAKEWPILYNTASNGPVWPHLVNGDYVTSRIWSIITIKYNYDIKYNNNLNHIEAELRILGLRFQVMAGMSLWSKIEQIWPNVAYNGPTDVLLSTYDKFWPYLCLYHQFWPILAVSIRFDHIAIKVLDKCENAP